MTETKKNITYGATLFFGVTLAYTIWLMWKFLTELIGDGLIVLGICVLIVVIGLFTGFLSVQKIAKKFK